MNIEEIEKWKRFKYKKKCPFCGLNHVILTQDDSDPEYYTDIYIQCQCDEFIKFTLPVN